MDHLVVVAKRVLDEGGSEADFARDISNGKWGDTSGIWETALCEWWQENHQGRVDGEVVIDHNELFWSKRPYLARIKEFMNYRGISEWAGLGAVLAYVGQTIPPQVVLPPVVGRIASLNMFWGLAGPPGATKTSAMDAGEEIVEIHNFEPHKSKIGTGEGIPKLYGDVHIGRKGKDENTNRSGHTTPGVKEIPPGLYFYRNRALQTATDIATLYAQMTRSGATLLGEMLSAFDGSQLGHAIAGPNRVPLGRHQYRWGFIVGIQYAQAQKLLAMDDSGFLQRLLVMPALFTDRIDYTRKVSQEPIQFTPPHYVGRGEQAHDPQEDREILTGGTLLHLPDMSKDAPKDKLRPIALPRVVVDDTREFDLLKRRGKIDPVDHHCNILRLKLAAHLMWFDGREDKMREEDWELAGHIIEHVHKPTRELMREGARAASTAALSEKKSTDAAANAASEAVRALAYKMKDRFQPRMAKKGYISSRDIQNAYSRNTLHKAAVDYLVSSGVWVKKEYQGQGGRGSRFYPANGD
ncbi:hypothetical protein PP404_25080 [Mycobacteroides abscessus]|nr:hypothetical protein [Mycobacteroides abscessus]MDM2180497.1 hypothetical protein [Mycobacteroides abscessus]MDM2209713.1 hypothetical protein [Mycobacteroides abscessus]MDM2214739.1 hypothetical protein [Mycobacteroides abscessus]MDM2219730.1 hypothetical protein [Mycobacteroides abscessus]